MLAQQQCRGSGRIRNFWPDPKKNISDLDPGAGSEMNVKLIYSDKQMLKLSISQQNAQF
jgi:hypothetical protein